jgi:hypothetical protein
MCECEERKKPIKERAWFVYKRFCNYSAFNGYRYTPSDYSSVCCPKCHRVWRTKAAYINELRDGDLLSKVGRG